MNNTFLDNWYKRPMLNQEDRLSSALLPSSVKIDGRSLSNRLAYLSDYAKHLKYFDTTNTADGSWYPFLSKDIAVVLSIIIQTDKDEIDSEFRATLDKVNAILSSYNSIIRRINRKKCDDETEIYNIICNQIYTLANLIGDWQLLAHQTNETPAPPIAQKLDDLVEQLQPAFDVIYSIICFSEALCKSWSEVQINHQQKTGCKNTNCGKSIGDVNKNITTLCLQYQQFRDGAFYIIDKAQLDLKQSLEQQSNHSPDTGLLITFLELLQIAQNELNQVSRRHLDYYYRTILEAVQQPPQPDEVIVFGTLGRTFSDFIVKEGTLLTGKREDNDNVPIYSTSYDVPLNLTQISELKTIFVQKKDTDTNNQLEGIYQANISTDIPTNNDLKPTSTDKKSSIANQRIFKIGERVVSPSTIGLTIGSPLFFLNEGSRTITISFEFQEYTVNDFKRYLANQVKHDPAERSAEDILTSILSTGFNLSLSTADGWKDIPYQKDNTATSSFRISDKKDEEVLDNTLDVEITLLQGFPAVVTAPLDLIQEQAATPFPLVRITLNPDSMDYPYFYFEPLRLKNIDISVDVKELRQFNLFNSDGKVDDSNPYPMFGAVPKQGSYLAIANQEIYRKELDDLSIQINWDNLPDNFDTYFNPDTCCNSTKDTDCPRNYNSTTPPREYCNKSFEVSISDLNNFQFHLLEIKDEDSKSPKLFQDNQTEPVKLCSQSTFDLNIKITNEGQTTYQIQPDYNIQPILEYNKKTASGLIKIELTEPRYAFGYDEYQELCNKVAQYNSKELIEKGKDAKLKQNPNPPFVPMVKNLTIDYTASTTIPFLDSIGADEENPNYVGHLLPYGFQPIFQDKEVYDYYFLPTFSEAGDLYIGLKNLQPPQQLSLYFKMEEAILPKVTDNNRNAIVWNYLSDNDWKVLKDKNLIKDETENFTTSGIIILDIPAEITNNNTQLPDDTYWLKVTIQNDTSFLENSFFAKTQAIRAVRALEMPQLVQELFPYHLTKPKNNVPQLAQVLQPFASFDGVQAEPENRFYARVSERLRHRNRAATYWDYERMVLQQFPNIQQVKCIATQNDTALPTTRVIVIPKVQEFSYTLQARASLHTLLRVKQYLKATSSPFARIEAINPDYEPFKVIASVNFEEGYDNGEYVEKLNEELNAYLSPHSFTSYMRTNLSQTIQADIVEHFIEERYYVSSVERIKLKKTKSQSSNENNETDVLRPQYLWSVLIPVEYQDITISNKHQYGDIPTTVDTRFIGVDTFVVAD